MEASLQAKNSHTLSSLGSRGRNVLFKENWGVIMSKESRQAFLVNTYAPQSLQKGLIRVAGTWCAASVQRYRPGAQKPIDFKKNRNLKLDSESSRAPDLNLFLDTWVILQWINFLFVSYIFRPKAVQRSRPLQEWSSELQSHRTSQSLKHEIWYEWLHMTPSRVIFLAKLISSAWSSAQKPFDFKKNRNLRLDSKNSRAPDLNFL